MKVLHITSSLDGGGIARLLYDYCTRMIPEISFDFAITSETKGMLEDQLTKIGCNIFHIPKVRQGIKKHCDILETIMREGHYDIVHEHSDYKSLFSLYVAKKVGIKNRVVHSHLAYVPETILQKKKREIITKIVMKNATQLMACSLDAAKWMWGEKTCNMGKVTIMTNAILTNKFLFNKSKRVDIRKELGIENCFVLGNVARFSYQKNHDFLLEIFKEVERIKPDSRLLLIGDGELKTQIAHKVKLLNLSDKIIFLGTIGNVEDYLNAMDVFVLPSRFEGLGIVYVEAQANGLECYATKEAVPEEANVCGLLTFISNKCSAKEWAKNILRCKNKRLTNPEEYIVKNGYDIDNSVNRIRDFYFSLVNKGV